MRIRIRGPAGTSTITLPDSATIEDLKKQIAETTSVAEFDVKYGYPPKPLLLDEVETASRVTQLDVGLDGEQLIVSPKQPISSSSRVNGATMKSVTETQSIKPNEKAVKREAQPSRAATDLQPPILDAQNCSGGCSRTTTPQPRLYTSSPDNA